MSNTIKITMLGDDSVGRTCYMLGMYAEMQREKHGFTLSATNKDEHIQLIELWSNMVKGNDNKRWPPGGAGDQSNFRTYNFDLNYAFIKNIIKLKWLDYRGEITSNKSTEKDREELKSEIKQSTCLFLCISGKYLSEPITEDNLYLKQIELQIPFIVEHLAQLNQDDKQKKRKYLPIVIIITKYDLCFARKQEELIEDVKKLLPDLFVTKSSWLVMICPTTLGKQLAQNLEQGKIVPKNLDLPLFFAIVAKYQEQITDKNNNSNLIKPEAAKLLAEELENCTFYFDGEEVQINV